MCASFMKSIKLPCQHNQHIWLEKNIVYIWEWILHLRSCLRKVLTIFYSGNIGNREKMLEHVFPNHPDRPNLFWNGGNPWGVFSNPTPWKYTADTDSINGWNQIVCLKWNSIFSLGKLAIIFFSDAPASSTCPCPSVDPSVGRSHFLSFLSFSSIFSLFPQLSQFVFNFFSFF